MRLGGTAACVLGVMVAAVVPADAAAKSLSSCARAHSKTVKQNSLARVYRVRADEGFALYGCRRSTGRRTLLDTAEDDNYVSSNSYGKVRLAGTFVAWAYTSTDVSCKADCPVGYNPTNAGLKVHDLRRRRARDIPGPVPLALVLSPLGGIAWASQATGGQVEIHRSLGASEDVVVDSGNIDPSSLAIEITIISWRRDGVERFARLR